MNRMISTPASRARHVELSPKAALVSITYATSDCVLGRVLVARSDKGVCALLLGADQDELKADLAIRFPRAKLAINETALRDDLEKVRRFLMAPGNGLHLTLDMRGTPFQRRVWEKLRTVPVGRTATYTELAREIGALASPRAVAGACAANPVALAIPCHRIIRSNGDLAGYRWGIERKRELIKLEAAA